MGMKKIGGSGHVESAWKVPGKFGGKGLRKVRGKCVESLWKVRRNGRGKCAESWRVWAWNVRGKFEGVGVRKFIAGTRGGGAVQS